MSETELVQVLAKVQLGDNRQVDRLVLAEWRDTIGDLDLADALEAVRMHRRETTDYLQPAHVRANVRLLKHRRAREERIAAQAARRALPAPVITLDRAKFEAETQAAIEAHRGH